MLSLHHVAVLVPDIERASAAYVASYGYEIRSAIIDDPVHTAAVRFLALPSCSVYLELVAPCGPKSVLQTGLAKGGGLHHMCFAADAIDDAIAHLRGQGAVLIRPPAPAVAFRNQPIAWLMDSTSTLVELVERGAAGQLDFPAAVRVTAWLL
jgi:methylmalonyl-CoA/ethylmalonyl-CoA epimerase